MTWEEHKPLSESTPVSPSTVATTAYTAATVFVLNRSGLQKHILQGNCYNGNQTECRCIATAPPLAMQTLLTNHRTLSQSWKVAATFQQCFKQPIPIKRRWVCEIESICYFKVLFFTTNSKITSNLIIQKRLSLTSGWGKQFYFHWERISSNNQ